MNQEQFCENCVYFSPAFTRGTCRRYAPKSLSTDFQEAKKMVYTVWPTVEINDFCGEWKELAPGELLKRKKQDGKIALEESKGDVVVVALKSVVAP